MYVINAVKHSFYYTSNTCLLSMQYHIPCSTCLLSILQHINALNIVTYMHFDNTVTHACHRKIKYAMPAIDTETHTSIKYSIHA